MRYRLALDIGTNSIGWWAYELNEDGEPARCLDGGVRIFADGRDPQSGKSLAEDRRTARGARRRRDRFVRRKAALMRALISYGLMPEDEATRKELERLDPFELRARALDGPLPPHHLGRALFHLNQRRGFKSNRKADDRDNEAGAIRTGVARLEQRMMEEGTRTFGEFLHKRRHRGESVRARLRPEMQGKGNGYDFYPDRKLLEAEFDAIWQAQAAHHPDVLTEEARDHIRRIIFYQRPLKAPKVGKCTYNEHEERLPKAHPLFQQLRLYQEVNHLEVQETGRAARKLTRDERDKLILKLSNSKEPSFKTLREKVLKLPEFTRFNKETENRTKLKGDEVNTAFSAKKAFGPQWAAKSWQEQWAIIDRVLNEEDPQRLLDWLITEHSLSEEQAEHITFKLKLPKGHGRLGLTATQHILAELQEDVITYDEAVKRVYGSHSDFATGEVFDELPYYGHILTRHIPPGTGDSNDAECDRVGRITNPTVHIGLGQLRRLINALIKRYGKPAEIVVELARELKMTDEQKTEYNKRLRENTQAAERRREMMRDAGVEENPRNHLLLRLWQELEECGHNARRCVYSGRVISLSSMLFSGAVDIDHILPFSRTLDDSPANKIVCVTEANREKRNHSPYEAWGHTEKWEAIAERAQSLPGNKRWRFASDAMQRFDEDKRFLDRQLVETQYLARMARLYLAALYPVKLAEAPVWVTPGRLTALLRRRWGLNGLLRGDNLPDDEQKKARDDHRHHAIDAAVIGLTDRKLLNRISRASGQMEAQQLEDYVFQSIPPQPWDGFREEVKGIVARMTVSHRPRHKTIDFALRKKGRDRTAAQLHEETAYGLTGEQSERGDPIVVYRVPLTNLKSKDIHLIRDAELRDALWTHTRDLSGKEFEKALVEFTTLDKIGGKPNPWLGIRRVRITRPLNVIPIRDRKTGLPYKGYKGGSNYRYDVWELPNGKWAAEVISMFDAHQPGYESAIKRQHPTAKKLMRIFQNDMAAWEKDGRTIIGRVVKFGQNGQITLAPHNEANVDARNRDKDDPFKFISPTAGGLKKMKFRLIKVDETGRVFDPGPWDERR